jgi:hypothetical protein
MAPRARLASRPISPLVLAAAPLLQTGAAAPTSAAGQAGLVDRWR